MTQQSLKTVLGSLADAIIADIGISAFMAENYGEGAVVDVHVGIDEEDLPDATSKAVVYILPGSRSRTRGDAYRQHTITLECMINSTTTTTVGSKTSLDCLGLLDDFTNLVEKVAFKCLQDSNLAVTPTTGDNDEVYYPIAQSQLAYIIEIPSRI